MPFPRRPLQTEAPPAEGNTMIATQARGRLVGLWLTLGSAVLIAATVWLLPATPSDRHHACLVAAALAGYALGCAGVDARGAYSRIPLAYALGLFGAVACIGGVTSTLATSYTGLITIAFIYIGLYAPRGSSTLLIAPAVGCWLLANGVLGGTSLRSLEVRLPMAVAIWCTIGGLLSQYARAIAGETAVLRRAADRDPLTGLHNRRALDSILAAAVPGDTFALLDLDRFKQTNDTLGHAAGDQVLVDFARVLTTSLRDEDIALRFGGDEFLVYLPATSSDLARTVMRRLRNAWSAETRAVSFSGGVATVGPGCDGTDAIGEADRYLYRAKAAGRGRCLGPAVVVGLPTPREETAESAESITPGR